MSFKFLFLNALQNILVSTVGLYNSYKWLVLCNILNGYLQCAVSQNLTRQLGNIQVLLLFSHHLAVWGENEKKKTFHISLNSKRRKVNNSHSVEEQYY